MTSWHALLSRNRFEQHILIIKAEIRQGRYRSHFEVLDRAVRTKGEAHEGVGYCPVPPMRLEGVVLPVLEFAHHRRGMLEAQHELAISGTDGRGAVPRVGINPSIFFQR